MSQIRLVDQASTASVLAQAKWQDSGITDDVAAKLQFKSLQGAETITLHHTFHPVASLHIPYFDFDGRPTGFYRIRYLEPLPGFSGMVEKPQRYAQPPGSLNEVYIPPLLKAGWQSVINDPTITVFITEGELKAAAAAMHGFPTLGLGGVDVWRSSRRGIPFLPQLEEVKWNGREVIFVFDSDAATNPRVTEAQRRLAGELLARGAKPRIAAIPPGPQGKKRGLDDYLLLFSPEEFIELVDKAPELPESDALWKLNEEIAYIREPGLIIERSTGRRIGVDNFIRHAYANRYYTQIVMTAGRPVLKKMPLAPRWIGWEHRYERRKIIYEPGKPHLYEDCWNSWPGWGTEEKPGDMSLWHELLEFFFKGDHVARKWFEQWCAYPIQHPGTKLYSACLLWSVNHGTGKSLLAYLLKSVYGINGIEIDSEQLRSSFNSWAENKQFVIGDEITAGDARIDKDKLKRLITRPVISVNEKYLPEFLIRDCINYLFTSNDPGALFVEDSDRRYFVQEITGEPLSRAFYEKCDAWLNGDAPGNMLYYLRHVDLTGFNPREHALPTEAKREMIYTGKSDLGVFVAELREDPETKLALLGKEVAKNCDIYTPSMLLRCFDPEGRKKVTAPGLAREMIRSGYRPLNGGTVIRTKTGIVRLYALRNIAKWMNASPKEIADHFDKFHFDRKYD